MLAVAEEKGAKEERRWKKLCGVERGELGSSVGGRKEARRAGLTKKNRSLPGRIRQGRFIHPRRQRSA